jgi:hypothetical protein
VWRGVGDGGAGVVDQGEVGSSEQKQLRVHCWSVPTRDLMSRLAAKANTFPRFETFLDAAIETESHIQGCT